MIVPLLAEAQVESALGGPVGFAVAFVVGAVSFFSPCVLPVLPGYLSFVSGLSGDQLDTGGSKRRVVLGSILFVLGFGTMFTVLGLGVGFVGGFFADPGRELLMYRIAGALVIAMGLAFMAPQLFPFLERERRPLLGKVKPGLAGAFPLGLAFAFGWTPCVGPGLGAILNLAAPEGSPAKGALLLAFFSLGFGVWFVLAGLGVRKLFGASSWLRRRARAIQTAGGAFMVLIGVLLVTDVWSKLMSPLRRMISNFAPPI